MNTHMHMATHTGVLCAACIVVVAIRVRDALCLFGIVAKHLGQITWHTHRVGKQSRVGGGGWQRRDRGEYEEGVAEGRLAEGDGRITQLKVTHHVDALSG